MPVPRPDPRSTAMAATLAVTSTDELRDRARAALRRCGVTLPAAPAPAVTARTPITGEPLFAVPAAGRAEVDAAVATAKAAYALWRTTPAPVRGRLVKH